MERLRPIDSAVADIIDLVVTKKLDLRQVNDPRLGDFLQRYINMNVDQDSRNVMMRNDEYVIIDPE